MKLVARGEHFARYQFGDIDVIALRDGYVNMPTNRLRQDADRPFKRIPKQVNLVSGKLRLSVNAFLIVEDGQNLLIDTGASNTWRVTMGYLPKALEEANVVREEIGAVGLTHTHEDHVSGLIARDGSEMFPNARCIFVPKAEIGVFGTRRYAGLRRLCVPVDSETQVSRRIKIVMAPGHSPGHMAYEIESSAGPLLIWGDIVHVPSLQFSNPEITWALDDNQHMARKTRLELLDHAVSHDAYVAGAHLEFPGIGQVKRSGGGYIFTPATA